MKGLLVKCDECKLPIRECIRQKLLLDPAARVAIKDWCRYMKGLTGDDGCNVQVRKAGAEYAERCRRPAMSWAKTPWGCACTSRVCRKHSRNRKVSENACICPRRPPMVGRGGGAGEPSPWQENAIRAMEGDQS